MRCDIICPVGLYDGQERVPLLSLPASRAASLTRFARSAPVKPTVELATVLTLTSFPSGSCRRSMCTRRICSLPMRSGRSTETLRSKRPGRSSALSSTCHRDSVSGRLCRSSSCAQSNFQ